MKVCNITVFNIIRVDIKFFIKKVKKLKYITEDPRNR